MWWTDQWSDTKPAHFHKLTVTRCPIPGTSKVLSDDVACRLKAVDWVATKQSRSKYVLRQWRMLANTERRSRECNPLYARLPRGGLNIDKHSNL